MVLGSDGTGGGSDIVTLLLGDTAGTAIGGGEGFKGGGGDATVLVGGV